MPAATSDERRRSFDQMARLYARARGAPPPALFDAVAAFVPPPADALEIGCGPGGALALIWGSPRRTAEDNRVDEAAAGAFLDPVLGGEQGVWKPEVWHVSSVKHEYLGRSAWAMAGGSPEHAAIAASVTISLGASSTAGRAVFTAPACASASARRASRRTPTVALVSPELRQIEVWRRDPAGWLHDLIRVGGVARLGSIECALVVDEVFLNPLGA